MCIAAPAQVVEINREDNWLYADFGGARQQANEEAAKESLEAWEELLEVLEEEDREMEQARMNAENQ